MKNQGDYEKKHSTQQPVSDDQESCVFDVIHHGSYHFYHEFNVT